ncbi:MAG: bifunctional folylpolyglutamate synthase/dihydrofolate synthase [archaeon]|nr:bifunctional folylpolyglutamate synthase/dihydrofolate synthase [archaeon]
METKDEILNWLYGLNKNGIKFGLENTKTLLQKLGHPEDSFRKIHIAGSDGKGSTSAMIASILNEAGVKTGLFTSPHIINFNERITVSGKEISDVDLKTMARIIRPIVDDMSGLGMKCTFFEVTSALAFLYFKEQKVEYAVIETGMGGRFDATNVITPDVSIITNISMEHVQYLGDTIEKIATEKAGIIKKGVPVVTCNDGVSLKVISATASESRSKLIKIDAPNIISITKDNVIMKYRGESYDIGIPGDFQAINAAMAIDTINELPKSEKYISSIKEGLRKVKWPCRMQKLKDYPIILDVTHTKAGSKVLADNIEKIYGKVTVVIGVLADKDIDGIAENIGRIASKVIVTVPVSERASPIEKIEKSMSKYVSKTLVQPDIYKAIDLSLSERNGKLVLITGSFIMAEGALKWMKKTSVGF